MSGKRRTDYKVVTLSIIVPKEDANGALEELSSAGSNLGIFCSELSARAVTFWEWNEYLRQSE